uniref:Uncharacterized protein n=1 Tax=Romanomermis culicivorax TaxID=13658 RepID=A0A915I0I0_ROMCU
MYLNLNKNRNRLTSSTHALISSVVRFPFFEKSTFKASDLNSLNTFSTKRFFNRKFALTSGSLKSISFIRRLVSPLAPYWHMAKTKLIEDGEKHKFEFSAVVNDKYLTNLSANSHASILSHPICAAILKSAKRLDSPRNRKEPLTIEHRYGICLMTKLYLWDSTKE